MTTEILNRHWEEREEEEDETSGWEVPDVALVKSPRGFAFDFGTDSRLKVPPDFVFAIGDLFGAFEPLDRGPLEDGTRDILTRKILLETTFGEGWKRYARAHVEFSTAHGVPLRIRGLPREKLPQPGPTPPDLEVAR